MENIANIVELNNQDIAVVAGGMLVGDEQMVDFSEGNGSFRMYYLTPIVTRAKNGCSRFRRCFCTAGVGFICLIAGGAFVVIALGAVGAAAYAYHKGYI